MSELNGLKVVDCWIEEKIGKNNKPYQLMFIRFSNGYQMDVFLSNEQQFILKDLKR